MKNPNVTIGTRSKLSAPRACGQSSKLGGIYAAIPSTKNADGRNGFSGSPMEAFLIDPCWPIPDGFGLSAIGMQLRLRCDNNGNPMRSKNGKDLYDVWDYIGASAYPNVLDWVKEIDELGFHQLLSPNLQFNLLTEESEYIAVHSRAYVEDAQFYYDRWQQNKLVDWSKCPFDIPNHLDGISMGDTCPGILSHNIVKGVRTTGSIVRRDLPSVTWYGFDVLEKDEAEPLHHPAAFMKLPLGYLADFLVYEDKETHKDVSALEKLEALEQSLQRIQIIPWES